MALRNKRNKLLRDSNSLTIKRGQSTNDKNYLGSTSIEQSIKPMVLTSSSNSSVKLAKTLVDFNKPFVDNPVADKQSSYCNTLHSAPCHQLISSSNNFEAGNDGMSTNSDECLRHRSSRLAGGVVRHAADKVVLSPNQCKLQPAGLNFFDAKKQVNVINLQLNDVQMKASGDDLMLSQQRRTVVETRTRATQTLFRESSAQTLPYLPGVSDDTAELESLEIFKLPTILPGNGPPGLYEVEVLERARRRWAFAKALKENFRKQFEAAKEQAKLQEHDHILEAFEWEHWIEREENIQECQMLRLELLIRMFEKREREMRIASKNRIQKSYEEIEAKRKAALKKNDIEHNRAMRRLEIKHARQPRVWRKEHITHELSDPSSEFYAPKMRYGVNPSRRHYTASRIGFDMRMDDLERKVIEVKPKNLKCPFAKLKEWSKPKQVVREVEQNFCSDANLNKLYESLRTLRETSKKQKYTPLCLKAKEPANEPAKEATINDAEEAIQTHMPDDTVNKQKSYKTAVYFSTLDIHEQNSLEHGESFDELRQQKQAERLNMEQLRKEMCCEELEALINSHEGNTIGWLMRFLSEEMCRLKEQRKLQFFTMMAKRQRWHREAAEAGLRQKENCMRDAYEKMYEECDKINKETADTFLNSILRTDVKDFVNQKAEQDVADVARELDKEISSWLESFKDIQNPLNYHTLRHALKDIVVPDVDKILYRLERDDCIDYIINYVLLNKVYHDLEPYEVSFSLVSDFVDRLLDNDLYLHSPDFSSECDCTIFCSCSEAQNEAKSVIRKVIRYAVPGRRWYTEKERIAAENVHDILDDVFKKVITENGVLDVDMSSPPNIPSHGAHTDLFCEERDITIADHFDETISFERRDKIKFNTLRTGSKNSVTDVTKALKWSENLLLVDPDELSIDNLLINTNEYVVPDSKRELSVVHIVPSTHDLSMTSDFCTTPTYAQTSSEERLENMQLEEEGIGLEMSLSYEDYAEVLQGEEETGEELAVIEVESITEVENQQEEEKQPQIEVEEINEFENVVKVSAKYQTVKISEKSEEKIIDDESTQEEDSSSSFMQVSFTYNSQVKFSVAMPSNDNIPAEESTNDETDNANTTEKNE